MENPSDASGRSTATGDHVNMVEASKNTQQQTTASIEPQSVPATEQQAAKKRKQIESRSTVWKYFEPIKECERVVKGKCNYCAAKLGADSKIHGTSSLRNHVLN